MNGSSNVETRIASSSSRLPWFIALLLLLDVPVDVPLDVRQLVPLDVRPLDPLAVRTLDPLAVRILSVPDVVRMLEVPDESESLRPIPSSG